MKVKKIEKHLAEIDIISATLLTIEEARKLPEKLREYINWWWLKSSDDYTTIVFNNGFIYTSCNYVDESDVAVRPALKISNLENSNFKIGDQFEFGRRMFEIISENFAFCLQDIGEHCFRKDWEAENANDYEKSDVKKFVNEWFNEAKEEQ